MDRRGRRITEEDKASIRMLREEGRTYHEISVIVGVSVDTARHHSVTVKPRTLPIQATALTLRPAWFEEDIAGMMSVRKLF